MKSLRHLYDTQSETFSIEEYMTALDAEQRNDALRSAGSPLRWIADSSLEPDYDNPRYLTVA